MYPNQYLYVMETIYPALNKQLATAIAEKGSESERKKSATYSGTTNKNPINISKLFHYILLLCVHIKIYFIRFAVYVFVRVLQFPRIKIHQTYYIQINKMELILYVVWSNIKLTELKFALRISAFN